MTISERITGLPTTVNIKSISWMKSLYAADNSDYTKADAVNKQFSEYIYEANEKSDIKADPWEILQNKYPDVVYHVGDIAMFDKNNLIPYRQDFPVSKLFEKDADLEKLASWRPKINSNTPTGFEDYIQADRARIPKGTRAVMIHPDVKERMEKDIQYANDILRKVDDFFQREIMINEQLVPGCTLGMNQFAAIDADGKIGYNCSVTHGQNGYEEPWQKNITPSLIREMEKLYKEADTTSKSRLIQPEDESYKLNMEENDHTEYYQNILGIASEEMWKKKYLLSKYNI